MLGYAELFLSGCISYTDSA